MKKIVVGSISIILIIISILFISCSDNKQVGSRARTENSPSSKDAQSKHTIKTPDPLDISKMNDGTKSESETGFGIFLMDNNELIISDKHIKAYYKDTHEIELNAKGIKRIKSLKELNMKDFVVIVNDKEIYKGKFWSRANSMIYLGVIISDILFPDNGKIKIDFGYPSPQYAKGKDPRNNQEITDYFEKRDILK